MIDCGNFIEVELNGVRLGIGSRHYRSLFTGICLRGSSKGVMVYMGEESYFIKDQPFNELMELAENEDFEFIQILMKAGLPKSYITQKINNKIPVGII